jgi:hypothetical protein
MNRTPTVPGSELPSHEVSSLSKTMSAFQLPLGRGSSTEYSTSSRAAKAGTPLSIMRSSSSGSSAKVSPQNSPRDRMETVRETFKKYSNVVPESLRGRDSSAPGIIVTFIWSLRHRWLTSRWPAPVGRSSHVRRTYICTLLWSGRRGSHANRSPRMRNSLQTVMICRPQGITLAPPVDPSRQCLQDLVMSPRCYPGQTPP